MNIFQKINKVMGEVSYVQKEKKGGMRYSIVSHDSVTALLRGPMQKEGIVYYPVSIEHTQNGNRTEVSLSVRFVNMEDVNDFIDVPSLGYGIDDQDKGPGKAISYAVKYALLKTFGLETGDDPDTEQDSTHKPSTPQSASKGHQKDKQGTLQDGSYEILITSVKKGKTNEVEWELITTGDGRAFNKSGVELSVGEQWFVNVFGGRIMSVNPVETEDINQDFPPDSIPL